MPMVQTRHGALHYLEVGTGVPLVLLHGNTYSATTQERLAARFADEHRVISPDLLGHGQSARPEGLFSPRYFTLQGEALADLLTGLFDRPVPALWDERRWHQRVERHLYLPRAHCRADP